MALFTRLAVAVGTTVAVTALFVPPASAARGAFVYYTFDSGWGLSDPKDKRCYPTGYMVREVDNGTNRTAFLYASADCTGGASDLVPPGTIRPVEGFLSVSFEKCTK